MANQNQSNQNTNIAICVRFSVLHLYWDADLKNECYIHIKKHIFIVVSLIFHVLLYVCGEQFATYLNCTRSYLELNN